MKKIAWIVVFILCQSVLLLSFSMAEPYNPKPSSDDFTLPMPGGAKMVFRRVFIGEGEKPFALKSFKVGDTAGGFKEFPTDVVIGGSFIEKNPHGEPDWVYYLGKYEVTEAQYEAVMKGSPGSSQNPITNISWFDAQEFINTYNLWLFEKAKGQLPKNETAYGYVRLPTEVEWEFAARGGSAVSAAVFDKKHPYSGELNKYEWFSGPRSSHDKLKEIGLRQPNPLGLHDMLGNASEMTSSFYQIEYYQGRLGGFVARGGNYVTEERQIRSSLRNEIPFYKDLKSSQQLTLGLRLVIASPIYASRETSKKLEGAWDEYVDTTRIPPAPPAVVSLPTGARAVRTISEARSVLQQVANELQPHTPSEVHDWLEGQLGTLGSYLTNVESMVQKSEHESAYAWVKIAAEAAFFVNRELKRLPLLQKALKIAQDAGMSARIDQIKERVVEAQKNINDGLTRYGSSFEQLEKTRSDVANMEFENYSNFLKRQGAVEQVQVNLLVKTHYKEYMSSRRLNLDKWKVDLGRF